MMLHTYTPLSLPSLSLTFYTLYFLRHSLDNILNTKVTTARSKVKLRPHHDVAYLHHQIMSSPSINYLYIKISENQIEQDKGSRHRSTHPFEHQGENNNCRGVSVGFALSNVLVAWDQFQLA